jgi:hypothetical protein
MIFINKWFYFRFRTYSRKSKVSQPSAFSPGQSKNQQTPQVLQIKVPQTAAGQQLMQPELVEDFPSVNDDYISLVPPNRASLVGMRGLLLSLGRFKQVRITFSRPFKLYRH